MLDTLPTILELGSASWQALDPVIQAAPSASPSTPAGAPPASAGSTEMILWGSVLLVVALALALMEVFLPSGGLLALLAGVAAAGSIAVFFTISMTYGLVASTAVLIALPILSLVGIRVLPDTFFIRWITLRGGSSAVQTEGYATQDEPAPVHVGAIGVALTDLRPVGACRIGGEKVDCMSQGPMIPAGTEVKVTGQSTGQWIVRRASSTDTAPASDDSPSETSA